MLTNWSPKKRMAFMQSKVGREIHDQYNGADTAVVKDLGDVATSDASAIMEPAGKIPCVAPKGAKRRHDTHKAHDLRGSQRASRCQAEQLP